MDYYEIAYDSMKVYPQKFGDKVRTEWQEGWNAYGEELLNRVVRIGEWVEAHPMKDKVLKLIEDDMIFLKVDAPNISAAYISSDIFAWGYADCEKIEDDMWDAVYEAAQTTYGLISYHCRRYNEKPQWPIELRMRKAGCWDLEDLPECRYDLKLRWTKQTRKDKLKELGYVD